MSSANIYTHDLDALYQGDSFTLDLCIVNSDDTPADITLNKITLTIKESDVATDSLYTYTEDQHKQPSEGLTEFKIGPSVTSGFPARELILSVVREDLQGEVTTLVYAPLKVIKAL